MTYGTDTQRIEAAQDSNRVGGLARGSRIAFLILAAAFAMCVAVQIYIAGMGVFAGPQNWAMHVQFVHVFELLPVLMLILSFTGKLPARMRVESGVLLFMIGYMYFAANIAGRLPLVAATHPVMAVVMLVLALSIVQRASGYVFQRANQGAPIA